jgi:PAS domain S-box-containing protein
MNRIIKFFSNLISNSLCKTYKDDRDELLQKLSVLEEKYNTLVENLAAALAIHTPEGKITFCSPYIEVLTGYSTSEILNYNGNFLEHLADAEDKEKVAKSIKVSQYGEAFQFRYRFHHKTGLGMWAETRIVPLLKNNEEIYALLSITLDITGSMRYQNKVEEHNQDLKDFSYMISHDLKSPLVTVRGMITACLEDYKEKLPSEATQMLNQALNATERLDRLVKGVLDYAQLTNRTSVNENISGSEIIQEVLNEKKQKLNEIKAEVRVSNIPTLLGDRTMLYQVFANIIGNAIKYRHPDRTLRLDINTKTNNDNSIQVLVTDNGRGIPASKIDDIFRPFQRAHGKEIEGAGIGLASVKKLIERMGGSVSVESKENEGSTFVVTCKTP